MRASEPASHASQHASHASHASQQASHASQQWSLHLCEGIIFRQSLCNFWRNAPTVCSKWTLYVMWIRDLYIQNDAWPGFVLWCNIFCRKILVAMYLNLLYCIKNPVDVSFVAIFIQTFVNYLILTLACLSIYLPWKCTFGTQSRVCRCQVTVERNLDQIKERLSSTRGYVV